ncbi:MAG: DUF234 domain-containing protein [Sulfurovum sp.]|nr:DUF234 domain-containing protein [Sulfurovum sp.]
MLSSDDTELLSRLLLEQFQNFYNKFPFLKIDTLIEYFALYGGVEKDVGLNLFEDIELSSEINFIQNFNATRLLIKPSYLIEAPYAEILIAVARGDGRVSNICSRTKIGESVGNGIISKLVDCGILTVEDSRQAPLKTHPKQLLPRHLRGYKIESKVRFVKPFYHFWFAFVEPYRIALLQRNGVSFINNLQEHKERVYSLLFEQLSNLLLEQYFSESDPLLSQGSFWDHHSEFDLLSLTRSGKVILGECKYTSRKVTKKELNKLKDKAKQSSIIVDSYALFSKSGFSNELLGINDKNLLLFELDDFKDLL